jgi:hypothetical protein
MIELILNYFPFLTGFPSRMHARQAAVLALRLLLILTLVTATQAKEEVDIVANAQVSLEQIAQTAESEVQSHRTELANLMGSCGNSRLHRKSFKCKSRSTTPKTPPTRSCC